jgi:hypothetical protein
MNNILTDIFNADVFSEPPSNARWVDLPMWKNAIRP